MSTLDIAIAEVVAERARQDAKWGPDRDLHNLLWNAILGEEVGEAAKEVVEWHASDWAEVKAIYESNLRRELAQVAAVAIAWIENLERRGVYR